MSGTFPWLGVCYYCGYYLPLPNYREPLALDRARETTRLSGEANFVINRVIPLLTTVYGNLSDYGKALQGELLAEVASFGLTVLVQIW